MAYLLRRPIVCGCVPIRRLAVLLLFVGGGSLLVSCGSGDRGTPRAHEPKVLLVGIDGVRVDKLADASTPTLDSLIAVGAYSDSAWVESPTVSGPGWSSMLTGVWPGKHRVSGNDLTGNAYARFPDFLTRLEILDPTLGTLAVADWSPLGTEDSGGPLLSDRIDSKITFDGYELGWSEADSTSVEAAIDALARPELDAAFVYLGNPDEVAHATNTLAPAYVEAIAEADGHVDRLLRAIRDRPTFDDEDWLILLSTDHGRRDDGGHGGESTEEHRIWILASGPSVSAGSVPGQPGIVDVAVTAMTHLGVSIRPEWDLDGKPFGLR